MVVPTLTNSPSRQTRTGTAGFTKALTARRASIGSELRGKSVTFHGIQRWKHTITSLSKYKRFNTITSSEKGGVISEGEREVGQSIKKKSCKKVDITIK